MSTRTLGETLTISELFSALDAKIAEQISLARDGRPRQNPFSARVASLLSAFGDCVFTIHEKIIAGGAGLRGETLAHSS